MNHNIDLKAVRAALDAIDYEAIHRFIASLVAATSPAEAVTQRPTVATTSAGTTPRHVATAARFAHADLVGAAS